MKFNDAYTLMEKGYGIRRKEWHNTHLFIMNKNLYISQNSYNYMLNGLTSKEILADDWILNDTTIEANRTMPMDFSYAH